MCWTEERNSCKLIRTTLIFIYTYIVFANDHNSNNRYILIWTNPHHFTFPTLQKGNKSFVNNQCRHQNCFISNKYTHVAKNLTHYDAILFNAVTLRMKPSIQLPKKRSKKQKYIFVSAKSAADFPVSDKYNNFFHWTWTYKLNSDISNAYIVIKDKNGEIIGPKQDMHWITAKDMEEVTPNIASKLQFKTTAAAWIVSNCDQKIHHETYIQKFKTELGKHNHTLDIFGTCGDMNCPEDNIKLCYTLLESKYYFYLSFEDSVAEDYVTDQLLTALSHFTVPLVFGGANYTRFMPEGFYLNALELGPTKLARKINDIIGNREAYYDMFKWHDSYSFYNPYDNPDTNGICELCNLLNNENRHTETKVYENIVTWFNDRKDWNLESEDEKVEIKHITKNENVIEFQENLLQQVDKERKNEISRHLKQNKADETIDKPEFQDVRINSESENPLLHILYDKDDKEENDLLDKNNQKTSPSLDKAYEDNTDGFAEVMQMQNIIKTYLYNDAGLELSFLGLGNETGQETPAVENNEQINNIQYSTEKDSIIDLFKYLEKEVLTNTENVYTTEALSTQSFDFPDYQQFSYVEKTTTKQEQTTNKISLQQTTMQQQLQTTTIKKNNDSIEEQLKKENKVLKDALKRFEKMIILHKQKFSIRNISNSDRETTPFDLLIYDDKEEISLEKPQINNTDTNKNQIQILDFDNVYHSTDIIRRVEEETTKYSTINYTTVPFLYTYTDGVYDGNYSSNYDDIDDNHTISTTEMNEPENKKMDGREIRQFDVLIWTNSKESNTNLALKGKNVFIKNKCKFQNCVLSNNYSTVTHLTKYDAVIFNAVDLQDDPFIKLPQKRDKRQKYVLFSRESAAKCPITTKYNNFFNWTWTYKLDSDIRFTYIVIKDKNGKTVGPAEDMDWIPLDKMAAPNETIISKLKHKTNAAAWIMPDCEIVRRYETYVTYFRNELRNCGHVLNIFGNCGNKMCPNNDLKACYALLESEYYFYLSFEDSMAEDYVTDQLLTALNHFVVPLVFGGGNYTRFMPQGIYLDALELGPVKLARKVCDIISMRQYYYNMFRWHNYYSYHNPLHDRANGVCAFCALLNDQQRREEEKVYKNIVKWFNDRKDWNIGPGILNPENNHSLKHRFENMKTAEHLSYYSTYNFETPYTRTSLSPLSNPRRNPDDDYVVLDQPRVRANYAFDYDLVTSSLFSTNSMQLGISTPGPIKEYPYVENIQEMKESQNEGITTTSSPKDTSIRCPDIATCFQTIVTNVKSKLISFLQ